MSGAGRRGNHFSSDDDDEDLARSHITRYAKPILDIETWSDYWSEELAATYHVLIDQCTQYGLFFLERCHFPDFVEFVYKFSSKLPPPPS